MNGHSSEYGVGRETGVGMIAAERVRQITEKGFDAAHDDQHTDGSILHAGILIATDVAGLTLAERRSMPAWVEELAEHVCAKYDETTEGQVQRLAIAGAMIAAEIDRRRRAAARSVASL